MGAKFVGQKIIMPWTIILSMPIPSQSAKSVVSYIKKNIMALGVHFIMGWDMLKKNARRKTLRWVHLQHSFCKSLWMMRRQLWHNWTRFMDITMIYFPMSKYQGEEYPSLLQQMAHLMQTKKPMMLCEVSMRLQLD
jgi:hypothetical protein